MKLHPFKRLSPSFRRRRTRMNRLPCLATHISSRSYSTPTQLSKCLNRVTFHQHHARSISTLLTNRSPHRAKSTNERFYKRRLDHHYTTTDPTVCNVRQASSTTEDDLPKVLLNDMANQEILIDFGDGDALRYPSFWLRDHCLCSECSHPHTHQRQIDTYSLNTDTKASSTTPTTNGLEVSWEDSTKHVSIFPWSWLQKHSPFPSPGTVSRFTRTRKWVHCSPSSPKLPSVPYESVMSSDEVLRSWIDQIHVYGFSFVSDTPATPEATESLLHRIAFIRDTHYGAFWDFTSNPKPIDTAYTNDFLFNHTDNTYWTDPAGLQMFHCLEHTSTATPDILMSGKGGESTFVDGFAAAAYLYKIAPKAYHALSSIPIICSAEGAPVGPFHNNSLQAGVPVLSHYGNPSSPTYPPSASNFIPKYLSQVRWNNADRSPMTVFPNHQVMKTWYSAAKIWSQILQDRDFVVELKLKPGMPVIFDNWRLLHGRKRFEGKRRICGGYINMDDFRAKGRVLGLDI